jgi:hypothetical protein
VIMDLEKLQTYFKTQNGINRNPDFYFNDIPYFNIVWPGLWGLVFYCDPINKRVIVEKDPR